MSGFPPVRRDGPWLDEPDYLEFTHAGFECRITRGQYGTLMGYVVLDVDHPLFGLSVIDARLQAVHVHGGWSWANDTLPNKRSKAQWVIGFDCAHGDDFIPYFPPALAAAIAMACPNQTYRTFDFVQFELKQAAEALAKLKTEKAATP